MKFLLDECLPHAFVAEFAARGYQDTFHPLHVGWRQARDDQLLGRAIADDRIIVSPNARDFRRLIKAVDIHPGLIIVEQADRSVMLRLIMLAIGFIEAQPDPGLYMICRVIEVTRSGGVVPYLMPSS